jgi:hypothetical protein
MAWHSWWSRGQVPANSSEVYRYYWHARSALFFDDAKVGVFSSMLFEYVAAKIANQSEMNNAISESSLLSMIYEYLTREFLEDLDVARRYSQELLISVAERAGIIRQAGISSEGEPYYLFASRTLMFYGAAAWMIHAASDVNALARELTEDIKSKEKIEKVDFALQICAKAKPKLYAALIDMLNEETIEDVMLRQVKERLPTAKQSMDRRGDCQ